MTKELKQKIYEPEIGQALFGNPTGIYETPEYVDAFIDAILNEIERVYWNNNQEEWDRSDDPKIKGIEFRRYYWGEDEKESIKPNLKFSHTPDQEIRWYKYPGRGQTSIQDFNEKEWINWFNKSMSVIRKADKDLF